jgi:hypothetical protein
MRSAPSGKGFVSGPPGLWLLGLFLLLWNFVPVRAPGISEWGGWIGAAIPLVIAGIAQTQVVLAGGQGLGAGSTALLVNAARHLRVGLGLGVMLGAAEVPQVPGQQFATGHAAAVVIEIVVHQVGIVRVDPRVLLVLVLGAVPGIVLVEDIVVIDQGVGRAGEEIEQQLLDLGIKDALHLRRGIEVGAFGVEMRQRDAGRGDLGQSPRSVRADLGFQDHRAVARRDAHPV